MDQRTEPQQEELWGNRRMNTDFVQITRNYLPEWRQLTRKSPLASEILMFFLEHMGKQNNAIVASYATIMEMTGRSRATVARAIKLLKEQNWIDVVNIGTGTAYAVNERVAWRTNANQRKYAMFSATVIASASEQKEKPATGKLHHVPVLKKERH